MKADVPMKWDSIHWGESKINERANWQWGYEANGEKVREIPLVFSLSRKGNTLKKQIVI
jgi:hypothetical protein